MFRILTRGLRILKDMRDFGSAKTVIRTVGFNGDYKTLNEALIETSKKSLIFKHNKQPFLLRLKKDFVLEEQILVKGFDLSSIMIDAEDDIVPIRRSALEKQLVLNRYPAFGVSNGGHLPIISALFEMDESGPGEGRDGVFAGVGSRAIVTGGVNETKRNGVMNAGGDGVSAQRFGQIVAHSTIFTNAKENGCNAGRGGRIDCSLSQFSGAAKAGIYCWRGSVVEAYSKCLITDCGTSAIHVEHEGTVNVMEAECMRAKRSGIYVANKGTVNAPRVNVSNADKDGIEVREGGDVNAIDGIATDCKGVGVHSINGSCITATRVDARRNGQHGARAIAAEITMPIGKARIGDGNSPNDIVVYQGGIIRAEGAEGGTNLPCNKQHSGGIIYRSSIQK